MALESSDGLSGIFRRCLAPLELRCWAKMPPHEGLGRCFARALLQLKLCSNRSASLCRSQAKPVMHLNEGDWVFIAAASDGAVMA